MFHTGCWVGAGRWPGCDGHPFEWQRPIVGLVVAGDDPRLAQGADHAPCPEQVVGLVPVCWDYHTHALVRWEAPDGLRSYAEDLALWKAARDKALDDIKHPALRGKRGLRDYLPAPWHYLLAARPVLQRRPD